MGATAVKIEGSMTVIFLTILSLRECSNSRIRRATHAVMADIKIHNRPPRRPARKDQKISYRIVGSKIAALVTMNVSTEQQIKNGGGKGKPIKVLP